MRVPEFKNVEEMQIFLDQAKENGAFVFQPSSLVNISYYTPVLEHVALTDSDVYVSQGKVRVCLSGLVKLGNAAGIEWDTLNSCRLNSWSDKMYIVYRAVGGLRKNDGHVYPFKADYDIDLDIVKEELSIPHLSKKTTDQCKNMSDTEFDAFVYSCICKEFIKKRTTALTRAESGARARAIRFLMGIQGQYDNKNLIVGKDFFIVRFALDHKNTDIKKVFLETTKQSMLGLYGIRETKTLPLPMNGIDDADDAIDVGGDEQSSPEQQPSEVQEPTRNNTPPTEREQFIQYDAATQGSILYQLSKKAKYDVEAFYKKAKVTGADQLSDKKRIDFYDFLITEIATNGEKAA